MGLCGSKKQVCQPTIINNGASDKEIKNNEITQRPKLNLPTAQVKPTLKCPTLTVTLGTPPVDWFEEDEDRDEQLVNETVEKCWDLIRYQREIELQRLTNDDNANSTFKLPVVRVFVSSTFADMFCEREILVKQVFPELRSWCNDRGLALIETDLRWGVPKNFDSSQTLAICLQELDRCKQQNEQFPFFIAMIGDRYGWIPSENEVPQEIKQNYNWIPNLSITHMEILHGALRSQNKSSIFFLRDSNFISHLPTDFKSRYQDERQLAKEQLLKLKQNLSYYFPSQVCHYSCVFEGIQEVTGRKMIKLGQLDQFADNALTFLKSQISDRYPRVDVSNGPEESCQLQEHFVRQATSYFVGREMEFELLQAYVNGDDLINNENVSVLQPDQPNDKQTFDSENGKNRIFYVTGFRGSGKTALLAKFASTIVKDEKMKLFYHFPNSSKSSVSSITVLNRLVQLCPVEETSDHLHSSENIESETTLNSSGYFTRNIEKLTEQWQNTINLMSKFDNKFVIIVDGLDKLDEKLWSTHLTWLPERFAENIYFICSSTIEYLPTKSRIEGRGPIELCLTNLKKHNQQLFATEYLNRYNKKLDDQQMSILMSSDHTTEWLGFALEEIRIFGDFQTLVDKIAALPDNIDDLVWEIIERLKNEDQDKLIEKTLCILACARERINLFYRDTLREDAMPYLLNNDVRVSISMLKWNQIRIRLGRLISIDANAYIGLGSDVIYMVVLKHLLKEDVIIRLYHKMLASFYDHNEKDVRTLAHYMPYHLFRSGQKKQVLIFYFYDRRSHGQNYYDRRDIVMDLKCGAIVHHHNNQSEKESKAMLCMKCSQVSKNLCIICGAPFGLKDGRLCHKHQNIQFQRCSICHETLHLNVATVANICQQCHGYGAKCCALSDHFK